MVTQPVLIAATAQPRRDTRIDVLRALALLTIFVNHVPGTVYEYFTHKHFGFSDSAEAFVLISGIAVGLAYGTKFHAGDRFFLMLKMWRRAATLYGVHIMTTLATLAIFCGAALFLNHAEFLSRINIGPIVREPAKALFGLVTLGHQLGYNNILPLYMVVMLAAPLMLYGAGRSLKMLLLVSGALYLCAALLRIAPPNYPAKGVWFLNPVSWQFLFVIGIAATVHVRRGGRLPGHPLLIAGALAYLALSLIWVRWNLWWIDTSLGLPRTLTGFNKTYLSLPRLLHILALAYVIAVIPALSGLARTGLYHPLAILGKHSLPVFVTGTIMAMAAQVLKQVNHGGMPYDTLLVATGVTVQFALAYYLEWLGMIGWSGGRTAEQRAVQVTSQDAAGAGRTFSPVNASMDAATAEKPLAAALSAAKTG